MFQVLSRRRRDWPDRWQGALALLVAFGVAPPGSSRADPEVYQKVAPATVGFYKRAITTDGVFDGFYGSGFLVDVERKLVVTAAHVVRSETRKLKPKIEVMFPLRDDKGNMLTEALLYKRHRHLAIRGTVVYENRLKDIALVQLDRLPEGVKAIPLAKKDPRVGDAVHVVGNSTYLVKGSTRGVNLGAAFGYSTGKVRNFYHYHGVTADIHPGDEPKAQAPFGPPAEIFFALVHHAPANEGDSGGPVVNNDGELVGIVSRGEGSMVLSTDVHVKEVRRALEQVELPVADVITMRMSADSDSDKDTPSMDNFYLPVRRDEEIHVALQGDGRTNLNLYAKDLDDPSNEKTYCLQRLFIGIKPGDKEEGSFKTYFNGICLIQVINLGDKDGKYRNDYTLTIRRKTKVRGPFTLMRQLSPGGKDEIEIPYEAGKGKARVALRGDHDMRLDLTVLDPDGMEVARCKVPRDVQEVTWTPTLPGLYTIRVEGKGSLRKGRELWSQYVLTTD